MDAVELSLAERFIARFSRIRPEEWPTDGTSLAVYEPSDDLRPKGSNFPQLLRSLITHDGLPTLRIPLDDGEEYAAWGREGDDGAVWLQFEDQSRAIWDTEDASPRPDPRPRAGGGSGNRDAGLRLLDPLTRSEHAAVERVLGLLWQAAADNGLSEPQERMILSIAEMIEKSHRETEPDTTPRWKLVGAVSAGLGYLFLNVPDGIVKWNDAISILQGIDWPNVAGLIGG